MKTKILFFLLAILPFISGCNNTEDVKALLVGKTWRLSSFMYNDHVIEDRYPTASDILEKNPNGFYLKFNDNNTLYGQAINCTFNGTWKADGSSNDLSINITNTSGSSDSQTIAIDFVNAVRNAYSYVADENVLTIKYKYNGKNESMILYVKKN